MARRAKNYKSDTAKKLRNPEYANAYLKAAQLNHDATFKEALADMINRYGHAEFAKKVKMNPANVTRTVKRLIDDEDIKSDTLELLLKGFGLVLVLEAELAKRRA